MYIIEHFTDTIYKYIRGESMDNSYELLSERSPRIKGYLRKLLSKMFEYCRFKSHSSYQACKITEFHCEFVTLSLP